MLFVLVLFLSTSASAKEPAWDKVKIKDLCAMSTSQVRQALAAPYIEYNQCALDSLYSAEMYGKRWVLYKSGRAFAVVTHSDYQGPCWTFYRFGTDYWDMCK